LAATLPRRLFLVRGPAGCRSICLTFDDGPHPEHTPRLLDVLAEHRIPATFFVIGERAEKHPDLINRIVAEVHTLGNHSYSHGDPACTSSHELLEEVERTRDLLERLTGQPTALVRPPHGKVNAAKLWSLWRAGQTVVLWNTDPKDFACESAEELSDWFRGNPAAGGDVLLLHDYHPYAARALPEWIEEAQNRVLTFTVPTHWLKTSLAKA